MTSKNNELEDCNQSIQFSFFHVVLVTYIYIYIYIIEDWYLVTPYLVGGFLRVLLFPPPIKLTATI